MNDSPKEAPGDSGRFTVLSRLLHWSMAAMVLAMLVIGATMVTSLLDYHRLVSIHRPLGILILVMVMVRFVNRRINKPPSFLPTMSRKERLAATASEYALYTLLFVTPLVGWAMLSSGSYPIVLWGGLHLPPILPANPTVYWALRKAHTLLAYGLFATFLAHLGAVLFHTLVLRDGLLGRMALWPKSIGISFRK